MDTLKEEMAKDGIYESENKSKIYSQLEINNEYKIICNEKQLEIVPPDKGLIISGVPIGSDRRFY